MLKRYFKTMTMTAQNQTQAGLWYLAPNYLLRLVYLIPLLMLWRILMDQGVDAGMSLRQMLAYTYVSTLLTELILLRTPLTDWLYDGLVTSLFQRPMAVLGQVVAQTLGAAAPALLFFSLPMAAVSPLLGVDIRPVSLWFLPSLALCVSLGFAVEFLFAALLIRMMNMRYLFTSIRGAIIWLLSGSTIPFVVLPWRLGEMLRYQPFGSLGGAVLSIYTGLEPPGKILPVQLLWNLVLWPLALLAFHKSREKLVSHNG